MKLKKITSALLLSFILTQAFGQNKTHESERRKQNTLPDHKFSVSTTWLSFANFGSEKTNTHHYEIHFDYKLSDKSRMGIKAVTWKLFAPMGIQSWDPLFMKESEFYPGKLRESGIGITYHQFLWRGLFAQIEILPLWKTYFNENNKKTGSGFKLYTTHHIGYHISLLKKRFYIEPQIHCNYWPVDTSAPGGFKEKDDKWKNYFLFEPNFYMGINF